MRTLGLFVAFGLVAGCGEPPPTVDHALPAHVVRMSIDDVTLFVPAAWCAAGPRLPPPWPNGVYAGHGGWGSFERINAKIPGFQAGPCDMWDRHASGFRSTSAGQSVTEGRPDPFFSMSVGFQPFRIGKGPNGERPNNLDVAELSYRAPQERGRLPHETLFAAIRQGDGDDVGNGWRETPAFVGQRPIKLRHSLAQWQKSGSDRPTWLAASDDGIVWFHAVRLGRDGWDCTFRTIGLPETEWAAAYETCQAVFDWLRTPPPARDATRRFTWAGDWKDRAPGR